MFFIVGPTIPDRSRSRGRRDIKGPNDPFKLPVEQSLWNMKEIGELWLVGGLVAINFIFPYIGNNHPNWLSYFSEGLKPPTRCIGSMYAICANMTGVYWWWMLPYIAYMDPMGMISIQIPSYLIFCSPPGGCASSPPGLLLVRRREKTWEFWLCAPGDDPKLGISTRENHFFQIGGFLNWRDKWMVYKGNSNLPLGVLVYGIPFFWGGLP